MQATKEQEQAIGALRDAYAAFNRGDIAAAVEALDLRSNGLNRQNFPEAAPTTARQERRPI